MLFGKSLARHFGSVSAPLVRILNSALETAVPEKGSMHVYSLRANGPITLLTTGSPALPVLQVVVVVKLYPTLAAQALSLVARGTLCIHNSEPYNMGTQKDTNQH